MGRKKHSNTSKLDFVAFSYGKECLDSARRPGEQLFALTIINHSADDYLFFGLGKCGYQKPQYFWQAVEFFFRTRSWAPDTWEEVDPIIETYRDPETGRMIKQTIVPDPETLKLQCFDKYFEMSGLSRLMSMDAFLENLKKRRTSLIVANREQVRSYLEYSQLKLRRKGKKAGQLKFSMEPEDFMEALVCPTSPEQLEEIVAPLPKPLSHHPVKPPYYHLRKAPGNKFSISAHLLRTPPTVDGQQEFLLEDTCEQLNNC